MTQEQMLIERGAESACGDLLFKGKVMGRYRNGGFHITEDGLAELEVIDVVVMETPAPTKRKAKAEAAPAEAE